MNEQEAFTKVVKHARKQGERAVGSNGECMYWVEGGNRCFLGALLSEERERTAEELCIPPEHVADELGLARDFANDLVIVHDDVDPEDWESALERLATKWDLSMPDKE
jgi:hypothetical protein